MRQGDETMLYKAIEHGKEHRRQYRGSKAIDRTCRNHGSCEYCRENRAWRFRDKNYTRKEILAESQEK